MRDVICGIYCIENLVNGKKYIGQSVNIERRKNRHFRELNSSKSPNKILQRAWNKYGEENFNFYVIEICEKENINDREIFYIKEMKSNAVDGGYNISWGGNAPMAGVLVTDEHRKKLSIANSGKNNAMYGKKLSKETLDKISKALSGRTHSELSNLNNSKGQFGNKRKNSSSKYFGVNIDKLGFFICRIRNIYTKERLYLGYFEKEIDAAKAFDRKSWEIYKDLNKLNFPNNYKNKIKIGD